MRVLTGLAALLAASLPATAALVNVVGPNSTAGAAPAIIAAPGNVVDDNVTNSGQQGFDEAQDVVTSLAYTTDGGSFPPARWSIAT